MSDFAVPTMWKRPVEKYISCHGVTLLKRESFIINYISQNSLQRGWNAVGLSEALFITWLWRCCWGRGARGFSATARPHPSRAHAGEQTAHCKPCTRKKNLIYYCLLVAVLALGERHKTFLRGKLQYNQRRGQGSLARLQIVGHLHAFLALVLHQLNEDTTTQHIWSARQTAVTMSTGKFNHGYHRMSSHFVFAHLSISQRAFCLIITIWRDDTLSQIVDTQHWVSGLCVDTEDRLWRDIICRLPVCSSLLTICHVAVVCLLLLPGYVAVQERPPNRLPQRPAATPWCSNAVSPSRKWPTCPCLVALPHHSGSKWIQGVVWSHWTPPLCNVIIM